MASGGTGSVLRRKAAAGRDKAPGARRPTPARALAAAVAKAADSTIGLVAAVRDCAEMSCSLAELLERLPEGGLYGVLEGPSEALGLMAIDPLFLASIVERQMTGRLAQDPPAPRRPTRTDAALTADLIDAILRLFQAEFAGRAESRWIAGFGFASHLDDPRPLGLMFEDMTYRVFAIDIDLAGGLRKVRAMLALPSEGRGPAVAEAEAEGIRPGPVPPGAWRETLTDTIAEGEVVLEAVLHRFHLSIARVTDLRVGEEIPLPAAAIGQTRLVGADGVVIARGRLGQSRGLRALRLSDGADPADAPGAEPDSGAGFGAGGAFAPGPALAGMPDLPMSVGVTPQASGDFPSFPDLPGLPDLT